MNSQAYDIFKIKRTKGTETVEVVIRGPGLNKSPDSLEYKGSGALIAGNIFTSPCYNNISL